MREQLPHEIVTVIGRTGSGKTRLIARLLAPRHRRRITIDLTGECDALYPQAVRAHGLASVHRTLDLWAQAGLMDWHLVAVLTHDEIGALLWALCPLYDGTRPALAALWGGLCIEVFEIDVLMPVSKMGGDVRRAFSNAYARGRHVGLSLLCATQRPHQCDRIITSQSQYVVTFAMHEPNDTKWLRDVGGERFATIARTELRTYESVWYEAATGTLHVHDADYRRVRSVTLEDQHGAAAP